MSRTLALLAIACALLHGADSFRAVGVRSRLVRGAPALGVPRTAQVSLARLDMSDAAAQPEPAAPKPVEDTVEEKPLLETTQRSVVKALSWRLTAAVITLCTSLFFSGSLAQAGGIVAADFLSKSVTMFIGERLWNKSNVGRSGKGDSVGRSLLKAVVWRLFAAVNTLISAGIFTGALEAAAKIAGTDAIIKTSLFFVFERVWAKIPWGRYREGDEPK